MSLRKFKKFLAQMKKKTPLRAQVFARGDEASSSRSDRNSSSRATTSNASSSSGVDSARSLPLKIIPDERTNSLIVVADIEMTTKVRALAEQLDSSVDLSGGRFYVYRLKHADAEELSEIVNQLISGASDSDSGSTATRGSSLSRSAQGSNRSRSSATTSATSRLADALRRRRLLGDTSGQDSGKVQFEGEVSIAPDPATNSVIINASRTDYLRVKELIDEARRAATASTGRSNDPRSFTFEK